MNAILTVLADEPAGTISPLLHGHFAEHLGRCCYDGFWVGPDSPIPNKGGLRADVVDALRAVGVPLLRWPGGCFADLYHWRDGIGPREKRPRTHAESCGERVVDDNAIGTHEFIALCREIGAEPYLAGNLGSGTVQELCDWVHYCNGTTDTALTRERAANGHPEPMKVRYWGVGNENWGCGGNFDAETYAKEYRRYATFLRRTDATAQLVACGDNRGNRDWNLKLFETLRNHLGDIHHLSLHRYWGGGGATTFTEDEYYQCFGGPEAAEADILEAHTVIQYFTGGRRKIGIAFDEWGIWHPEARVDAAYEAPSTLRDALTAAAALDIFHRHCDKVSMANLAQIVNVLHCLIGTRDDKLWLTPTYHVFALYAAHRGALFLPVRLEETPTRATPAATGNDWRLNAPTNPLPLLSATASRSESGITLSLTNRHLTEPMEVRVRMSGVSPRDANVASRVLTGPAANAANSADTPDVVTLTNGAAPTIEASGLLVLTLPPCSVQTVSLAF